MTARQIDAKSVLAGPPVSASRLTPYYQKMGIEADNCIESLQEYQLCSKKETRKSGTTYLRRRNVGPVPRSHPGIQYTTNTIDHIPVFTHFRIPNHNYTLGLPSCCQASDIPIIFSTSTGQCRGVQRKSRKRRAPSEKKRRHKIKGERAGTAARSSGGSGPGAFGRGRETLETTSDKETRSPAQLPGNVRAPKTIGITMQRCSRIQESSSAPSMDPCENFVCKRRLGCILRAPQPSFARRQARSRVQHPFRTFASTLPCPREKEAKDTRSLYATPFRPRRYSQRKRHHLSSRMEHTHRQCRKRLAENEVRRLQVGL